MVDPSIVPPLMSALVAVKLVIVMAAIVPPSTLSPDIWLSAKVKVPDETFKVLPDPTLRPTLVPVPLAVKMPSKASRSVFIFVPQVSVDAPTSGLVKFKLVVNVSAIMC